MNKGFALLCTAQVYRLTPSSAITALRSNSDVYHKWWFSVLLLFIIGKSRTPFIGDHSALYPLTALPLVLGKDLLVLCAPAIGLGTRSVHYFKLLCRAIHISDVAGAFWFECLLSLWNMINEILYFHLPNSRKKFL